jgi:4-hydroxy-2-oxoheptanedioate aldolase
MFRNPLLEKIKANKVALGINSQNPHDAEMLANVGFDYFRIDHMWSDTDWKDTQVCLWACEAAGITPVLRLQTNPWIGYDHHVAVDMSRAQGIGAQFITVNYADKKTIEEAIVVAKDWHRRPLTYHPFTSYDWDAKIDEMANQTFIVALTETKEGLETCEEIISMPEIKIFFISGTDGGRYWAGTESPGWDNPEFWKQVDKIVGWCEKYDVYVGMNPSYNYSTTVMRERVKKLIDHGIKMIMVQTVPFFVQISMTEWLDKLRSEVPF